MKRNYFLWLGAAVLLFLIISYFIKINIEQGANYIIKSSLLGVLIFNNPFVLGIYILISVIFIVKGFKKE